MVCPISQHPTVSLSGSTGPDFVLGEVFSVAFGLRSYSPELGRWVNRDPMEDPGNIQIRSVVTKVGRGKSFDYGFCHNGPIVRIDCLGMDDDAPSNIFECWVTPIEYCCGDYSGLLKSLCERMIKCLMNRPAAKDARCRVCKSNCDLRCQLYFGDSDQVDACLLNCAGKYEQFLLGSY